MTRWIAKPLNSIILVVAVLMVVLGSAAPDSAAAESGETIPDSDNHRAGWSAWSANWRAAALVPGAPGQLWLAGDNGIMRWDHEEGIVEAYSAVDGLPHVSVYDIAASDGGSIWLAGDGGISVRDHTGTWSHFPAPGALAPGRGMLMLGPSSLLWHPARDGSTVYELDANTASWEAYATPASAVEARYAEIASSHHQGALWRVSHGDVWLGFRRYDGAGWQDEPPPEPADAETIRQDAAGNLYLPTTPKVSRWDGSTWSYLEMPDNDRQGNHFVVTPAGIPWQTLVYSFSPSTVDYTISNLLDPALNSNLGYPANTSFALATDATIWLIAPGWIREIPTAAPRQHLFHQIDEMSRFYAARLTADGEIRLGGGFPTRYFAPDWTRARLNEHWPSGWVTVETIGLLEAWEYSTDGALWTVAEYQDAPPYRTYPRPPRRKAGDQITQWDAWPGDRPTHLWQMTVTSPREILFGVSTGNIYDTAVLVLDTRNTPTDPGDDRWTVLPLPTDWSPHDLVRDAAGVLWAYIYNQGLARYANDDWHMVFGAETAPPGTTLVPAADGALYAVRPDRDDLLVIQPDGSGQGIDITELATDDLGRLLTTTRRNTRLAVWGDELWFTRTTGSHGELVRRTTDGWSVYPLPTEAPMAGDLVVDRDGVVWLAAGDTIWRYGDLPSFQLHAQPDAFIATPGESITGQITLQPQARFSGTVALTGSAAPELDFVLDADEIREDAPVRFTMTAPAVPGTTEIGVTGSTDFLDARAHIQVIVVETRYDLFLPLVTRGR